MALATFESLPVEIFYEIQLYALSHSLPSVSRCLRDVFCASPPSFRAQYIYGRVVPTSHSDTFTKALRYPICTLEVLDALCRQLPDHPCPNKSSTCELPRRLFRSLAPKLGNCQWKEHEHPLPLLQYLYDKPRIPYPDPNAHQGYALTKAVHANFLPLIRFLLHHGASPQCKNGLAVTVAIRKKDLPLVKLLIEPDASPIKTQEGGKTNKAKRRRLEDRIAVNSDMLKAAVRRDAKDIVNYFIHEKACVPDLQTLQMMTKGADPT